MDKRTLKLVIKVALSVALLWFVFRQLNFVEVIKTVKSADVFYLFLAFVFFNLSKIVGSIRLNWYFKEIDINLPQIINLKLYYLGMFYNLFLPGGVGGDGYKAYLLNKKYKTKLSLILQALLLDRVSGLAALLFLAGVLYYFSSFNYFNIYILILALFVYPVFFILNRLYKKFLTYYKETYILGLFVQILQLISAYFIIKALPESLPTIDMMVLFLISSLIAVLPISIGGVGVREFTFLYGSSIINFSANSGVAFSLLFFLITLLSSLFGLFFLNFTIDSVSKSIIKK